MALHATIEERQLAQQVCEAGGLAPQQANGLALIIAAYRERLLRAWEAELDKLAAEAEQAPEPEAAAYWVCLDRLRAAIAVARSGR
jgi:NAD(P)H-dependent flavin oxidoreductase YrpB (nitropropane dioxygenase family)